MSCIHTRKIVELYKKLIYNLLKYGKEDFTNDKINENRLLSLLF